MVRGKYRSRTYARSQTRTPGGTLKTRFSLRKPQKAHCSKCDAPLHGVARGRPAQIKKLTKSEKVPSRPFAGTLCSACSRRELIARAR